MVKKDEAVDGGWVDAWTGEAGTGRIRDSGHIETRCGTNTWYNEIPTYAVNVNFE